MLTQPGDARPTIVDDRNLYRQAGVKKWVKNGFLNKNIKVPLGVIGSLRTQIEAHLLLQNFMLVADAMGLGAWIHATISPPVALGDPKFTQQYGKMLGFDFVTPKFKLLDFLRWHVPLPRLANLRSHPVGLKAGGEYVIKGKCPPYYASMSEAVNDVIQAKFGPDGIDNREETFRDLQGGDYGARYLRDAPKYNDDVIACARDVCEYILKTHGRFPPMWTPSMCRACGFKSIIPRYPTTTVSSETGSPMRTVIMMCIGTSREIAGVWRCGSMRQSSRRWRGLASMHDECNAKADILRYQIFAKSPCRPRPFLKRLAPATPSSISASRPLYHS